MFDQFIAEQCQQGVDMVVNLAAGLDTRPYRMALPPALEWVEVDLPGIVSYKEEILASEKPDVRSRNASASIYLTPLPAASSSPNSDVGPQRL